MANACGESGLWRLKATSLMELSMSDEPGSQCEDPNRPWPDSPLVSSSYFQLFPREEADTFSKGLQLSLGESSRGRPLLESMFACCKNSQNLFTMDEHCTQFESCSGFSLCLKYGCGTENIHAVQRKSACKTMWASRSLWISKWKEGDMQDWGDR